MVWCGMVWRDVSPSRTLAAEHDVKCASDTVAVEEEERYIAPPYCTIMPPPEYEPRRAEVPGAEEPTCDERIAHPTDPSVRPFGAPIRVAPVERVV